MKKSMFFAIIMSLCLLSANVFAQDFEVLEKDSGFVILKNNLVTPDKGKAFFSQTVSLFLQTHSPLGIGGDFTYQPNIDYVEYAPYLTLKSGPHYALLGMSAGSLKNDFVQVGYWHINTYAKVNVVVDMRAYLGTNKTSNGFLDNYLEVTYPAGAKFKAGIVAEDIYSIAGKGNTFQTGPIAYLDISKSVTIFGRYQHGWMTSQAPTSESDMFRLAIQYSF